MKLFKFTLQSLYDIKQTVEIQQKLQMKMIEKRISEIEGQIRDLREERRTIRRQYDLDLTAGVLADKLMDYGHFFELLDMREKMLIKQREAEQKRRQECLEARTETRREIKSLEKLLEIEMEEYKAEVAREEANAIGDLISYKVAMQ